MKSALVSLLDVPRFALIWLGGCIAAASNYWRTDCDVLFFPLPCAQWRRLVAGEVWPVVVLDGAQGKEASYFPHLYAETDFGMWVTRAAQVCFRVANLVACWTGRPCVVFLIAGRTERRLLARGGQMGLVEQ